MEIIAELIVLDGRLALAAEAAVSNFAKLFSRFHWTSLLSATLIALAVWLWQRREDPAIARKGFLAFLFPRRVWLHRSALLDYRFVLFDKLMLAALIGLGSLFVIPGGDEAVVDVGEAMIANAAAADPGVVIAYTVVLLLVEDFFRYWAHRLMHWSPLLWQFHKVHHSPEVLVPVSQLRTHPVNGLVNVVRSAIAIPVATVPFLILFPSDLTVVTIVGVNFGRFAFNMLGAQLRHSHIWLSFGPWLSRFVISPAQHQIHHSDAPAHRDKNFGSQFALWDWMFGTLYIPQRREKLSFGIGRKESERLQTVADLYFQPFRDARRYLIRKRRWPFATVRNGRGCQPG